MPATTAGMSRPLGLWMAPRSGHCLNLEEPVAFNQMVESFFSAVEGDGWPARDPRAAPTRSIFMGDKPAR